MGLNLSDVEEISCTQGRNKITFEKVLAISNIKLKVDISSRVILTYIKSSFFNPADS